MSLYIYGTAAAAATLVWEHVANINGWWACPSFFLGKASDQAREGFILLGKALARVSSFYTYLHLAELGRSVIRLTVPTLRLVTSPFWTLEGYIRSLQLYERAKNGNGYVVALGSITLLAGLAYLTHTYGYLPCRVPGKCLAMSAGVIAAGVAGFLLTKSR